MVCTCSTHLASSRAAWMARAHCCGNGRAVDRGMAVRPEPRACAQQPRRRRLVHGSPRCAVPASPALVAQDTGGRPHPRQYLSTSSALSSDLRDHWRGDGGRPVERTSCCLKSLSSKTSGACFASKNKFIISTRRTVSSAQSNSPEQILACIIRLSDLSSAFRDHRQAINANENDSCCA